MSAPITHDLAEYNVLKAQLLADYPELADDEQALLDTLEGITKLPDAIVSMVRSAREDRATAVGLKGLMSDMAERLQRLNARSEKKDSIVLAIMEKAGIPRIDAPDLTISTAASPAKLVIVDEDAIPEHLFRVKREPDKNAIKDALKSGDYISGVMLSNGGRRLNVRAV